MKETRVQVRIAVSFLAFAVVFILYLLSRNQLWQLDVAQVQLSIRKSDKVTVKNEWLVDGPHCRIRNEDPFDPSIQEYLAKIPPVVCSTLPPLTYISHEDFPNRILSLNRTLLGSYKVHVQDHIECCWSEITRVSQELNNHNLQADEKYRFSPCVKFKNTAILPNNTEFIYVRCESISRNFTKGEIVYKNMHAMAVEKKPSQDAHMKLNVVMIGIDSISQQNLRRTMPKSLNYLLQNNWIEMTGYNKVGDNTLPNLIPILTGYSVPQVRKVCMKERIPVMDNCPTLWKDFHQQGYLTSYAEDTPDIATFNYNPYGFVKPPTDYYLRPFMLAAHKHLPLKYLKDLPVCVGPQSSADLMFSYAQDVISTCSRKNIPHFGLFWLNSYSHNDWNSPAALDERLHSFLQEIDSWYNNTLLILLSDHGTRFGDIRNSFLGFLEERLPFLFLHLPKWFLETNPEAKKNLLINQHRLTSPYDLHMTLKSLIHGSKSEPPVSCPTCRSIFEPISINRACEDAGIEIHWCTCPNFSPVSVKDPLAIQAGNFLHQHVVKRSGQWMAYEKKPPTICAPWKLVEILRVHRSTPIGEDVANNSEKILLVVVQLEPLGIYESTMRVDLANNTAKFTPLGFISRLDSYNATSKCARTKMLQFYCYCSGL